MRTALSDFFRVVQSCEYDVIIITETWLKDHHLNTEVFGSNWFVTRCDRSGNSLGGGVMVATKEFIPATIINIKHIVTSPYDSQQCWLKISTHVKNVYIGAVYIRPNSNTDVYYDNLMIFDEILTQMDDLDDIFIFGDFNMPGIEWVPCEIETHLYDPTGYNEHEQQLVAEFLASRGLHQICNVKNASNNVLDLVVTNSSDDFYINSGSPLLPYKLSIYHSPLVLNYFVSNFSGPSSRTESMEVYDFKNADYKIINELLSRTDWFIINESVENKAKSFIESLNVIISSTVVKKKKFSSNNPPWWNDSCKKARNMKRRAYERWMKSGQESDFNHFVALSNIFTDIDITAYLNYIEKTRSQIKGEPKLFYKYVSYKKTNNGFPSTMHYTGTSSDDPKRICDSFADFYESVYAIPKGFDVNDFDYIDQNVFNIASLVITQDELLCELKQLDPNKGAGPDLIPALFLKQTAEQVSIPLLELFNDSLREGVFPTIWKSSFITSIFKSGDKSDIKNYRGIAILSAIPKLFEKIVTAKITKVCLPFINEHQHGFVKGRSTLTNLTDYSNYLLKNIENGNQIDAVYTDFSKAFDKINQDLLAYKLDRLGIKGSLIAWIKSYLTGRTQYARYSGCISRPIYVTSGVPQGSHLGPLLFILFINDLPKKLTGCRYLLYADDLKMFSCIESSTDCAILQDNINELVAWCNLNNLHLNIDKCNIMTFYRNKTPILSDYHMSGATLKRPTVMTDLGIVFDRKVTFKHHYDKICSNAMKQLNFIKRRAKEFDDPYVTKILYCSFVMPTLEYCSTVWNPFTAIDTNRIESVQKQFLLFALRGLNWDSTTYRLPNYKDRLTLLNMLTLSRRREIADTLFAFDLVKGNFSCHSLENLIDINPNMRTLRKSKYLIEEYHRTDYGKNEPFTRACRAFNHNFHLWNPELTKNIFKSKLKNDKSSR